ncbi:Vacuolar iron transporter-like protein 2.1 [Hibiscus syriacus]|uniref:Vacuolar iron transporter n=1 Tax=Hibiscus syriacus TaxID=106335 RepID=A0A6A2ZMK4_HIBSY|nr:vacuolar iron transporter homolog 2-like [Hibiscus syriacus]KAE8692707.1 Vacuolar iron transporter-like protein 2.1 [Hibiscus syriacus]
MDAPQALQPNETRIQVTDVNGFDYSLRGQWLRAAVLGANDGLVSVASLMMGVASVKVDIKSLIVFGFAGLVAGACSMAIGEYVSVCTQRDVEVAQMRREKRKGTSESGNDDEKLPNPVQAAAASALAFAVGAVIPLLAAAFIRQNKVRIAVVVVVATVALLVFGVVGALLGGTPVAKSAARVVVGGWMAMGATFGLTKLIGSDHGMQN